MFTEYVPVCIHVVFGLFVKWFECRMPVFPHLLHPFFSSLSLSFWGSGHVLVLIFLHNFMFMPTVTAYSFCFGFLAVDDVDTCVKKTRMSASLHSSFFPPCTVPFLFHLSHSLHGHLGWPRHTCTLCVIVLSDIASLLASLLTVLWSVDLTARHLLLFGGIVIITQCFVSLSVSLCW